MICITNSSIEYQLLVHTQLNNQTVLFLTIQYSISQLSAHNLISNSSIWLIERTLPGDTTPGPREPESGNSLILRIPQRSTITWSLLTDCLMSYTGHSLWGSYSSAEMQSMYLTAPADRAKNLWNCIHCTLMYIYSIKVSNVSFWNTVQSNMNNP